MRAGNAGSEDTAAPASDKGVTVLHLLAAEPGSGPLVRFLIQRKADLRARDNQERAPLS